jgi:hypothetical protein
MSEDSIRVYATVEPFKLKIGMAFPQTAKVRKKTNI